MSRNGRRRTGHAAAFLLAGAIALGVLGAGQLLPPPVAAQALQTGRITGLAVSPNDGTLWVGTARGLFRSGDRGRTLAAVPLPAKGAGEIAAVAVEPRYGLAVYAATEGQGVFRSEDGGQRWTAANRGLDALEVVGLAVAPNDGRVHAQVRGKGLFRSFDSGKNWERVDNGPPGTLQSLVSVNLPTGMGGIFLYAATDQGLVRGPD